MLSIACGKKIYDDVFALFTKPERLHLIMSGVVSRSPRLSSKAGGLGSNFGRAFLKVVKQL